MDGQNQHQSQENDQLHLLRTRRFAPYFWVQFLGAFNDNLIKTIMSIFIAYGLWDNQGWDPGVLVALAAGLFILPFALFTPFAGALADKYDKACLIRRIKAAEIIIILAAIAVLYSGNVYGGLCILFLLGLQSAFFSPSKFSILPQHLNTCELIAGNAFVTAGTYIAILIGSITAALIATLVLGLEITALIALTTAITGYIFARKIPEALPPDPNSHLTYNLFGGITRVIKNALSQKPEVRISILAVSFFYFVAATLHAQFPNFTKTTLGADNLVLTAFMATFSVGIALGGFLNHYLLKAKTDGRWAPLACLLIGLFGIDFYFTTLEYTKTAGTLTGFSEFLAAPAGLHLLIDIFLQAIACGIFVIPLRAIVQERTEPRIRARVISGSNMLDAFFILASSALSTTLLSQGFTIPELYLCVSVLTILTALALMKTSALKRTEQPKRI